MKYLQLRISSPADRGVLYEKDVDARNALGGFVRALVGDLVHDGTVHEGEHYTAVVVPRYGEVLRQTPQLTHDPARVAEPVDWVELRFEEPAQPDRPVRYFSVEVRVRERGLVYRRDFTRSEVGQFYVGQGVEKALLGLGVLRDGDYYLIDFFARDDDRADFDRERSPVLQERAASLVELVPETAAGPSFPYRDPASYGPVQFVGRVRPGDILIYVGRRALEALLADARVSPEVERGGILVGNVFENAQAGGRRIVEISDLIVSEHTISNVVELRYTFESWRGHKARLKDKYPGRQIVGWYHTHLVEVSVHTAENKVEQTTMFFSRDDLFLHKQFFPAEWYVALVLDAPGNSIFFQWKDGEIVACGGYAVFEDVGVAGLS